MSQPPYGSLPPTQPIFLPASSTCFTISVNMKFFGWVTLLFVLFCYIIRIFFFTFVLVVVLVAVVDYQKMLEDIVLMLILLVVVQFYMVLYILFANWDIYRDFMISRINTKICTYIRAKEVEESRFCYLVICAAEITSICSIHSKIRVTYVTKGNN